MAGREFIVTDVQVYRLEPAKIYSVTFLNSAADAQGVLIGRGRLVSTDAGITLKGVPGASTQFTFGGLSFPDGFTVFLSSASVTDIIIEYEDM